ncbi:class I SAM-dependent methyltransferase [Thiohalorhabdus sp. Cl-TMA]|uniref:Class I SAM-dependent methyltransferase n=1 Tax=Thiohalorhabdus methylotrophus TaxID=3242694 RepID=A0ABV4TXV6_9GAMM
MRPKPLAESFKFFSRFASDPGAVGAIAPSSPGLARAMVSWIDWTAVDAVAEYGPGTGPFTAQILANRMEGARFFAVERDPELAGRFRSHFPGEHLHVDSVENIAAICASEGVEQLDAVICGLPWASFSPDLQARLLDETAGILRKGGYFATFAYLSGFAVRGAHRFQRLLPEYFSQVGRSPVVWRNLPPAFVYRCRR